MSEIAYPVHSLNLTNPNNVNVCKYYIENVTSVDYNKWQNALYLPINESCNLLYF